MQGLRSDGQLLQDLQHVESAPRRPETYSIDPAVVKNIAKDLQKEFHPDRYSENGATPLQLKMSTYSSYINEAKATLLNDLQRAIYLMALRGVHIKEDVEVRDSQFMLDIF